MPETTTTSGTVMTVYWVVQWKSTALLHCHWLWTTLICVCCISRVTHVVGRVSPQSCTLKRMYCMLLLMLTCSRLSQFRVVRSQPAIRNTAVIHSFLRSVSHNILPMHPLRNITVTILQFLWLVYNNFVIIRPIHTTQWTSNARS